MAFEAGDEVVYNGSLGRHNGVVVAAVEGGPVDVVLDGISEPVRTDEDSLFGRYAPGGPMALGVTVSPGEPRPAFATGGVVSPGMPTPGFAHDDLATPAPGGNDVTPTEA